MTNQTEHTTHLDKKKKKMGGGVETTLKKTPGSYYRAVQYTVLAS